MLVSGPRGRVNAQVKVLNICEWCFLFHLSRCSVSSFAWANSGWGSSIFVSSPLGLRQERRAVSSRRRRLSLARASFSLGHPRPAWIRSRPRLNHTWRVCESNFLRKMGPFLGGMPPAVAPEGDLVFWGKPSCLLALLTCCYLNLCCQLGGWACNLQQKTWKS
jgi:hypothetical protein